MGFWKSNENHWWGGLDEKKPLQGGGGGFTWKKIIGGGGGLKLWAFHPDPPPHVFLNGIVLMYF